MGARELCHSLAWSDDAAVAMERFAQRPAVLFQGTTFAFAGYAPVSSLPM
jgi:hypothetical protein